MIIRVKLTKEKLKQELFYKGGKGTYIDITLLENKNGTDEYGNDGMVVQDVGKERRDKGEKSPIVGNFKFVGQRPAGANQPDAQQPRGPQPTRPAPAEEMPDDPGW